MLHTNTKQTRTRSRTRAVQAGPAEPKTKKRRRRRRRSILPASALCLNEALVFFSKKKVRNVRSYFERNSEFMSVVWLQRPSSPTFHQEKMSPLRWRSGALLEKSARSRSGTRLCLLCLCRTAPVRRKGEKTQRLGTLVKTSSVTQQSADPLCHHYRSTQTKKGGCWEVFGVWRHLTTPSRLVLSFLTVLFPQNIPLTCILSCS